ncbi:helix-turn-helix domain-containing protein [Streptosporangium sp. NPDC020072]|uniref:helix-turn-helix domain-containing protein n=1 Tax=Streptosporangium sp. NPDC020072 TaxID=3154788 RepID=UPI00343ABFE3
MSPTVRTRRFRQAGRAGPHFTSTASGHCPSFAEREKIASRCARKLGVHRIARYLRGLSLTISRELRRDASPRTCDEKYRATVAQWRAGCRARQPEIAELMASQRLREYAQRRLAGATVKEAAHDVGGGRLVATFTDLDGNVLGLLQDK